MRTVVLALGSRGDVQPYVALGLGLRAAGHDVVVGAHGEFEGLVRGRGLGFAEIEGNPRALLEGSAGHAWLETGRNPLLFIRRLQRLVEPLFERTMDDCLAACRGADAIVYSALAFAGFHAAEAFGIPCCGAFLQPFTTTRAFPSIFVPDRLRLGGGFNRFSHLASEQLFWQPFRAATNRWRKRALGLPPIPFFGPYARLRHERHPVIYGYSPTVVPRPADWSDEIEVIGYWFLDRPPDWRPPDDLLRFLDAGPPPVYVGFGSMTARDARSLTALTLDALAATGQRGVLLSGWSGLGQTELPDTVRLVREIPHDWLFPRTAAVVHHGGAGTTAAGLRAGVPSILAPFFADQPFWGQRVVALGVGPAPIPQKQLTAPRLAAAIRRAVEDEAMRRRAAVLGERIRSEDGVGNAVAAFERVVRVPRPAGAVRG